MTRRVALSVLAAALAVVLQQPALAQTAKDVQQKTANAWEAFKDYTHEKKGAAVTYGQQLMKQTDARITHLEGKASKASGKAKVAYEQEIKALKAKRTEAGKKLDEMGGASASAWDTAKQGFAEAYRELHHAYEKTAAKFK